MTSTIGVDTGGTFTDVVVLRDGTRTVSAKSATTPDDLALGVVAAVGEAARRLGVSLEELLSDTELFRLSGTTVTNVLVTGKGVVTGLLTTRGFEDTLHIGRGKSSWAGLNEDQVRNMYQRQKPRPLVPKNLVRGITERVDSSGRSVVPLSPGDVREAVDSLVAQGAEAVAIGFLWSIRNPSHEREAMEIARALHPELSVHVSHLVAPSLGEYERLTTTVIDALAGPVMNRLLSQLRKTLESRGFRGELLIAQADGGVVYASEARPVATLQSGPAAGVIASRNQGKLVSRANIVTADVGGTSFDVAVIAGGNWMQAREPSQGQFSLHLPMIEVDSVGAGGGSIGWVDELKVLHVGPHSAGAVPGPACYGRGGTNPTVTDAAVALGYINPQFFLGGRVRLDVGAATSALESVGEDLGLSAVEVASGMFDIANARMAGLLKRSVVSRGYDARDFTVFAYGGAGGLHGAEFTRDAGLPEVVFPALAGTFSALGVATAPLMHTVQRHEFARLPMSRETFVEHFTVLVAAVDEMLDRDGVPEAQRQIIYSLDMRYGLQVHTVRLSIDHDTAFDPDFDRIQTEFVTAYERLHGKGSGYEEAGCFVTALVTEGIGHLPAPHRTDDADTEATTGDLETETSRPMYFGQEFLQGKVMRYETLGNGDRVVGPAVIEARETTIVVPPGCTACIDEFRNVRIRTGADSEVVNHG